MRFLQSRIQNLFKCTVYQRLGVKADSTHAWRERSHRVWRLTAVELKQKSTFRKDKEKERRTKGGEEKRDEGNERKEEEQREKNRDALDFPHHPPHSVLQEQHCSLFWYLSAYFPVDLFLHSVAFSKTYTTAFIIMLVAKLSAPLRNDLF